MGAAGRAPAASSVAATARPSPAVARPVAASRAGRHRGRCWFSAPPLLVSVASVAAGSSVGWLEREWHRQWRQVPAEDVGVDALEDKLLERLREAGGQAGGVRGGGPGGGDALPAAPAAEGPGE